MKRFVSFAVLSLALVAAASADLLYVMDSGGTGNIDKLWAFDAATGALVNSNVFQDPNLTTPLQALPLASGNFIVVDQIAGIFEYAPNGTRLSTLVPSDATQSNFRPGTIVNGRLLYGVGGGTLIGTIQSVALTGGASSTWATLPSGSATQTSSPWGITPEAAGTYLVSNSVSTGASSANARVQRFDASGVFLGDVVVSNSASSLLFPQQIAVRPDGGFYVSGFSGTASGVYSYTAGGAFLSNTNTGGGNRGVALLDNGGFLTTQGTRVIRVASDGTQTDMFTGTNSNSFRFISRSLPVPEPASIAALGLGAAALLRRRRKA